MLFLILNVTIDVKNFVLINLCNPNTENEQVELLNTLLTMKKAIDINENTKILLAGDFFFFFFLIKIYSTVEEIHLSKRNPSQN